MKLTDADHVAWLAKDDKTRILCLDLGSHCGWADHASNSGSWTLWDDKATARPLSVLDDFVQLVNQAINAIRPQVICYEDITAGGGFRSNFKAIRSLQELLLMLRIVAEKRGIPLKPFALATIKKFASHGKATKEEMMAAYKRIYGVDFCGDDDQCDAAWMSHLFFRPDCWAQKKARKKKTKAKEPKLF